MPIRLGAVGYLNARPLVEGLHRQADRFALRFDPPSTCAALLASGRVDLGMIPSIELLADATYRVVPGVAIVSRGPVASVAVFSKGPIDAVRSIAVDTSSRTSVALLRILCARWFDINPSLPARPPDLRAMLTECDAALLIGDAALFNDHEAEGLRKIDLGEAWSAMTGLPFVYAFWAGRPGAVGPAEVEALQAARDLGSRRLDAIARAYCEEAGYSIETGARYLRDCIQFSLGHEELAGLARFLEEACAIGLAPGPPEVRFY